MEVRKQMSGKRRSMRQISRQVWLSLRHRAPRQQRPSLLQLAPLRRLLVQVEVAGVQQGSHQQLQHRLQMAQGPHRSH